jgi:hypothetical protein
MSCFEEFVRSKHAIQKQSMCEQSPVVFDNLNPDLGRRMVIAQQMAPSSRTFKATAQHKQHKAEIKELRAKKGGHEKKLTNSLVKADQQKCASESRLASHVFAPADHDMSPMARCSGCLDEFWGESHR